jgi:two-component system sensor histidine kinase DegS
VEIALYRIVQEALNNATKHANARRVFIQAYWEGGVLCCAIEDDGAGFDVQAAQSKHGSKGLGLIAMQERMNAIGGALSIDSARGKGTKVMIRLPMENANGH